MLHISTIYNPQSPIILLMKIHIHHWWQVARSSYWFVPSLLAGAAVVGAFGMLEVDRLFLTSDAKIIWLYSGGADGAKTLLSTVAGSIITVAGVVFSITIVSLSQASAQFGPRLLRNFMRDTSNQVVLGTFVATFLYCLLILRTIHGQIGDGTAFVPQASVSVAVVMAVASIAVLIYFMHHVSMLLQAPSVVAAVGRDFNQAMRELSDGQAGACEAMRQGPCIAGLPENFDSQAVPVLSTHEGYIQVVDYEDLIELAKQANAIFKLHWRAGDHLMRNSAMLSLWPPGTDIPSLDKRVNDAFICGAHRTAEQDVEFAIRQMVEVAVRALSPGINDPFTAINCIDSLGAALCLVQRVGLPGPLRFDGAGNLRLLTPVCTYDGIVDAAFNQIRQYGRGSVAVMLRLLEVISACLQQATTDQQRQTLARHAAMIHRQSQDPLCVSEESDRLDAQKRWEKIVAFQCQ